jgi:predicted O-methyltransferase YrrM
MIQALREVKRAVSRGRRSLILPVHASNVQLSAIASAHDDNSKPSDRLLQVALQAAIQAPSISMSMIIERMTRPPYYPNVWPGEHYKLLAGLVSVCQPRVVVEIGTAIGLSALAMREALPKGARLVTFDVIPWHKFPDTCLRDGDFTNGTLTQVVGDVSDPSVMRQNAEVFQAADIIFVDGPKDGRFERVFLTQLANTDLAHGPLLILDDIRLWNMLAIWREVRRPKLDVTSFGHWSGTGVVDWSGPSSPDSPCI